MSTTPDLLTPHDSTPTGVFTDATGSASFAHVWQITVKADDLHGAMDAVWQCWKAWQEGHEPIGGSCPARMGNRMDYDVKKTKRPAHDRPLTTTPHEHAENLPKLQ
jgi:hypothetical protein